MAISARERYEILRRFGFACFSYDEGVMDGRRWSGAAS